MSNRRTVTHDGAGATRGSKREPRLPILVRIKVELLKRLEDGTDWLASRPRSLYGLAVTRILLGIAGLGLLLTNFNARHYLFGAAAAWNGQNAEPASAFPRIWLFSIFRTVADIPAMLTFLYVVAAAAAVLFTLGWRTHVVGAAHLVLWVSLIELNDAVSDQGDNAYRIFVLLLLFTRCSEKWSFDAARSRKRGDGASGGLWFTNTVHNIALAAMVFQVFAIYVAGGFYKLGGESWQHGYAAYLPLQTAQFGTWPELSELVTAWGPAVVIASWGSIVIQVFFPFLVLQRSTRRLGMLAVLVFHGSIGVLMGIPWFSLAMIAVDAIFVRDRTYRSIAVRMHDAMTRRRAPRAFVFTRSTTKELV